MALVLDHGLLSKHGRVEDMLLMRSAARLLAKDAGLEVADHCCYGTLDHIVAGPRLACRRWCWGRSRQHQGAGRRTVHRGPTRSSLRWGQSLRNAGRKTLPKAGFPAQMHEVLGAELSTGWVAHLALAVSMLSAQSSGCSANPLTIVARSAWSS